MRHEVQNMLSLAIPSRSVNESFARSAVSAFAAQLDPTVGELTDLRTVVSEAVTNCIVHAYRDTVGIITITVKIYEDRRLRITVRDKGCGIPDVGQAMQPLFTTDPGGERGGMGFTIMDSFTDSLRVKSSPGRGTTVTMIKKLS